MEIVIKNFTKERGVVLDPFLGTGTTGAVCRNLNRDFIGIEINSEYFREAVKRIYNLS